MADDHNRKPIDERSAWMAPTSYIDIVGWIGSAAVVCAYALISLNTLNSRSRVYQALNLVGSLGLVINTAYHRAYPSTFVNIVWLVIAVLTLIRIFSVRSTDNPNFDSNTQV